MKDCILKLLLFAIVLIAAVECQRWTSYNRSNGKQNSRGSSYYQAEQGNGKTTETNLALKSQSSKQSSSRGGIGAWGYIAITLTIILSGLGVYYFVIFYPIVCKKERKYDVMEMTAV